ncbi:hypothetical protein MHH52_17050 [Paenibacillus sp. FSL K6-0276]|uniref:hypothetical protein n=1 Tax=Paenibacillus sp. FSL K6-0276 TaxID=2921450 RepID=UPI0030EE6980
MNKRYKFILALSIVLVIAIIAIIYIPRMKTSVENVLFDHIDKKEITEIRISKSPDYQDVIVKDKKVIDELISSFSEIKIRKSRINKFEEAYWIIIRIGNGKSYLINLYDNNSIAIYNPDKTKNKLNTYKIISEYDLDPIRQLIR